MDNFSIRVRAESRKSLDNVMDLVFENNAPGNIARSYFITKVPDAWAGPNDILADYRNEPILIFRWTEEPLRFHDEKLILAQGKFPFKMDKTACADFAWRWLQEVAYPVEPDQDGDNHKGWLALTDYWGHVGSDHYAIVGIIPEWMMYGK